MAEAGTPSSSAGAGTTSGGAPGARRSSQPVLFGPEGRPPYAGRPDLTPGYSAWDRQRWLAEPEKSSYRSDFERDRARVLHSAGLRRLGAKTQVVAPDVDDFSRTRIDASVAELVEERDAVQGMGLLG